MELAFLCLLTLSLIVAAVVVLATYRPVPIMWGSITSITLASNPKVEPGATLVIDDGFRTRRVIVTAVSDTTVTVQSLQEWWSTGAGVKVEDGYRRVLNS